MNNSNAMIASTIKTVVNMSAPSRDANAPYFGLKRSSDGDAEPR